MMREDDVAALLRAAAGDIDVTTAPADGLARAGREAARRRRTMGAVTSVTALASVALGVFLGGPQLHRSRRRVGCRVRLPYRAGATPRHGPVCACMRAVHLYLAGGPKEHAAPFVQAVDSALSDATAVPVTLRMRDRHNHVLFDGATTVTLHKYQPNGPHCAPTVWTAGVATRGTSHFTKVNPPR